MCFKRNRVGLLIRFFLGGLISLLIFKTVFIVARVRGHSMKPALYDGDYVLCIRIPHGRNTLSQTIKKLLLCRRAIVLVRPPWIVNRVQIKRIAGVAGDFRNWGRRYPDSDLQQIPDHHIFLVGDASQAITTTTLPTDSRLFGPCLSSAVIGRAIFRFWPLVYLKPK